MRDRLTGQAGFHRGCGYCRDSRHGRPNGYLAQTRSCAHRTKLRYYHSEDENKEEHFTVAGGIAEVLPDKVTILADAAENVEEIDIERALKARERAEEALKMMTTTDADRYLRVSSALRRSNLRLQAAQKYRKLKSRI